MYNWWLLKSKDLVWSKSQEAVQSAKVLGTLCHSFGKEIRELFASTSLRLSKRERSTAAVSLWWEMVPLPSTGEQLTTGSLWSRGRAKAGVCHLMCCALCISQKMPAHCRLTQSATLCQGGGSRWLLVGSSKGVIFPLVILVIFFSCPHSTPLPVDIMDPHYLKKSQHHLGIC